jgi:hypothetical protein
MEFTSSLYSLCYTEIYIFNNGYKAFIRGVFLSVNYTTTIFEIRGMLGLR